MFSVSSSLQPTTGTVNNETTTPPATEPPNNEMFSQIGSIVGATAAGGAASFKYSATFSSSLKSTISTVKATEGKFGDKFKASVPGMKSIGVTTLKAGGIGALVSGAASAISNGIEVLQGKKTGSEAVGTFAADTVNGTIGAMAGVTAGGLATMAMGSMLAGTPLLIAGIGVGALGAVLADRLFKGSGAYEAIKSSITNIATQGN